MRDPERVTNAYRAGVEDARLNLDLLVDRDHLDNVVGADYHKDYWRGVDDQHALDKILGRGRWVRTTN